MKIKTREEQRARTARQVMVGVGLWCHLRNLVEAIRAGENLVESLAEFQEMAQYAPPDMRAELMEWMERPREED